MRLLIRLMAALALASIALANKKLTLQSAPPPPTEPSLETRWPDDKPFSRFVQNLGHDLVALPSLNTALVIGAGGLGAYSVHGKDDDLANWAAESEPSFSILGNVFGDGWMQGGLATIAYVTGRVNHDVKTTHVASDLIRAQVLNGVLTTTLKVAVSGPSLVSQPSALVILMMAPVGSQPCNSSSRSFFFPASSASSSSSRCSSASPPSNLTVIVPVKLPPPSRTISAFLRTVALS